uniref:Radical SAM core domain-containing protein n=1 Tax=Rhodosorus marinus TaxID=101924 RepID=A0A7S3EP11_9RHOD|mmetsp:Transcript_9124/g.40066  ORF Transcript_9124/g.40066 Transcript_9124/m.40066 type:complete len:287 (+) Transcript_9124:71-931(+)
MGLRRHLSLGEIVDQVVLSKRFFDDKDEAGKRITNIVFMGMGEPLHNTENVIQATNILTSNKGLGLSHNKVTVSTSGLVPEIVRFFKESPANLAVSLNATTDEIRDWIMPINKKYNLASLLGTLKTVIPRRDDGKALKKIFFEYVLLKGVNDTMDDAKRIVKLTSGIPCKVMSPKAYRLTHVGSSVARSFIPNSLGKRFASDSRNSLRVEIRLTSLASTRTLVRSSSHLPPRPWKCSVATWRPKGSELPLEQAEGTTRWPRVGSWENLVTNRVLRGPRFLRCLRGR